MKRRWSAASCPAFAAPDTRSSWLMTAPATAPATSRCSQALSSSGIRSTSDRARRCRPASTTPSTSVRMRSSRSTPTASIPPRPSRRCSRRSSGPASISRSAAAFSPARPQICRCRAASCSVPGLVHAREHRTAGHRYPQWPTGDDRARRPRDLLATEPNGARVRDPAPDRAEPPALCRGAREHRVQCLFAGQGSTHHRCADHPDRSVCAEALPMIAQLLLTAFLALVLVYAWSAHRTVPIIGLLAGGAALAGLYFVWVPEHATALAAFAGVGRGSDLIVYTWVVISLLIMLNLHIKLRLQLDMITRLARAVAIDRAKDMLGRKAEAPPVELQAKK